MLTPRPAQVVPVVALLALLGSACSGQDRTTPSSSSRPAAAPSAATAPPATSPSAAATAPPTAAVEPSTPAAVEPSSAAAQSAAAVSAAEPSGGPLTVTAVRVARQEGFDRVVLELAGKDAGVPGWRVGYEDDPRRDGSGDPVQVTGAAVLVVRVLGAGYPFDTGQTEATSVTVPGDTEVVQDVELGSVFEGTYEAFVGVREQAPFTVTRLTGPARVVIDVRHP